MQSSERTGLRIKLHDIHVLMAVVQAGSMGRAATLLNTTQPAVSRSIAELEKTVGARLLERTPRGVAPTAQGKALVDGGSAAFDDLRRAIINIDHLSDPTAGEVRIGCTPILAASFVSAVVAGLAQRYPRMVFHLVTEYLEPLRRQLCGRSLDLVIVRRFLPTTEEQFDFEMLSEDRYVVAVGRHSAFARRSKIDLADLVGAPWTLPPDDSVIGPLARKAFHDQGLEAPQPTVIANSPETRISLLALGHFVTIFPASVLRFAALRSEIKVLPISLPFGDAENVVVTLKARPLSRAAQIFVESARQEALSQHASEPPQKGHKHPRSDD